MEMEKKSEWISGYDWRDECVPGWRDAFKIDRKIKNKTVFEGRGGFKGRDMFDERRGFEVRDGFKGQRGFEGSGFFFNFRYKQATNWRSWNNN